MHDLFRARSPALDPALAGELARAAGAFARLDQALGSHPLLPAFLSAPASMPSAAKPRWTARRSIPGTSPPCSKACGCAWTARCASSDRGAILAAASHALDLHQWLTAPDFDQEGEIRQAEWVLAEAVADGTPSADRGRRAARLARWSRRGERPAAGTRRPGAVLDPPPPPVGRRDLSALCKVLKLPIGVTRAVTVG